MTAYYVGDIPAEDLVIEPARRGDPIELDPFVDTDTEVELRTFEGETVDADFFVTFESEGGVIVLEWPGTSVLLEEGLHSLTVTLVGESHRERLAPVYIVVQSDATGWHTLDSARAEWSEAEHLSDLRLWHVLEMARQQIIEYAPALGEGETPPVHYRAGQLMQARNLLNAARVDPSGAEGEDTFQLRPYPLDWIVKQTVRPRAAKPKVR